MNCMDFRRLAGSDPGNRGAEFLRHRLACPACGAHAREIAALDARIRDALTVPVPATLGARSIFNAISRSRSRARIRWSAAAGVVLALGLALGSWLGAGRGDLAAQVVAHIEHEPELLRASSSVVDAAQLQQVFSQAQATLVGQLPPVNSAGMCRFRGHWVAHLVVRGVHGPVTVLLLPDEHVDGPEIIDEEGFRGTIMPVGEGSIAVVGMDGESMHEIEQQILHGVEWSI